MVPYLSLRAGWMEKGPSLGHLITPSLSENLVFSMSWPRLESSRRTTIMTGQSSPLSSDREFRSLHFLSLLRRPLPWTWPDVEQGGGVERWDIRSGAKGIRVTE